MRHRRDELQALIVMAVAVISMLAVVALAVPLTAYFAQYGRYMGAFGAGAYPSAGRRQAPGHPRSGPLLRGWLPHAEIE